MQHVAGGFIDQFAAADPNNFLQAQFLSQQRSTWPGDLGTHHRVLGSNRDVVFIFRVLYIFALLELQSECLVIEIQTNLTQAINVEQLGA